MLIDERKQGPRLQWETDMDMPLPEPVAWQRLVNDPDDAPHFYWEECSEWEAMNCTAAKDRRQLHTADQLRARDAQWRAIVAAEVAKERERAFYWCDFYAHAIDRGGNRYVRSNDALTAAHAVKSGTPAAAIRKGE